MAAVKNDGSVPYGTIAAWTINSVAYVVEACELTYPVKTIQRYNELGEPSGKVTVADFITGTATLQLANVNSVIPPAGANFNANVDNANVLCYVTERSVPKSQDGAWTVNIGFSKFV